MKMNSKKKLLILGGNSANNIKWIDEMYFNYKSDYDTTILRYDNWNTSGDVDIEKELDKLKNIKDIDSEYVIIAKSIGIKLAIMSIKSDIVDCKKAIFMGYPKKYFDRMGLSIIHDYEDIKDRVKCLFIQQREDKLCSIEEFKEEFPSEVVIAIDGWDHAYNNILEIKEYIDKFVSGE